MAGRTKLKAAAIEVPQNREQADRLLGEIGALAREIGRIEADHADQVALLTAKSKERSTPLAEALKGKFKALTAWAEANRSELLDGKRRSVALSQGTIGWRWGTPAVRIGRGQEDGIIATLQRLGLDRFLRVATTIDREAVLKEPAAVEGIAGVAVERSESFWAKPLDAELEQVATVQKVQGAAATADGESRDAA